MKEMTWVFILLVITGTSCFESNDPLRDNGRLIYEHDYPFAQDFLRYDYSSENRLENIFLVSETSERKRMSFEYLDTQPDKVIKVYYDNGVSSVITYDSLIYDANQLVEILNRSIRNDSILSSASTTLDYNNQGQLIKMSSKWNEHPSNCITELEFSDYVDNHFTKVDYKWCSALRYSSKLKYDKRVSPFTLLDKNIKLVLLTHFGGEAYNFITESNIVDIYTVEYDQPTLVTSEYKIDYDYDFSGQPQSSTMTAQNYEDTEATDFYRYK